MSDDPFEEYINFHQENKHVAPFRQRRQSFVGLFRFICIILLLISTFGVVGYFSYQNWINYTPEKAKAASISYSGGNISLDKKYWNGSTESDTIMANAGSNVTVRLKYNNTGTASATNAQITDSIPSGFSLVSNSVKNCYVDATCVSLNNNLFSGANLTVAPGAGYFGYATDNTLTTSNLEMGKAKYFNLPECWYGESGWDDFVVYTAQRSGFGIAPTAGNTDLTGNSPGCPATVAIVNQGTVSTNLTGNKYLSLKECWETDSGGDDFAVYSNVRGFGANPVAGNTSLTGQTPSCNTPGVTLLSSGTTSVTLLGNRYINLFECWETDTGGDDFVVYTGQRSGPYGLNPTAGNTDLTGNSPGCPTTATIVNQSTKSVDTLDTTRGYGYIEYQIISSPTLATGTYGTNVSMTGTGFSTLTDTATGTMTVQTYSPMTFTKQVSTDGTTFSQNLTGVNAQNDVYVRLNYNNSSDTAVTNSQIRDQLPPGVSLVAGSVQNCYADASCVTLNDNLVSSTNGRIITTPSVGYFGYGTTNSVTAGTFPVGKKKFFNIQDCLYENDPGDYRRFTGSTSGFGANGTGANNDGSMSSCASSVFGWGTIGSASSSLNITGQKYFVLGECMWEISSETRTLRHVFRSPGWDSIMTGPNNTGDSNGTCPSTHSNAGLGSLIYANYIALNILDNRYIVIQECMNQLNLDSRLETFNIPGSYGQANGTNANNTGALAANCTNVSDGVVINTTSQAYDLLDNSRGYGYIQYKVRATCLMSSVTLPSALLRGDNVSSISTNSNALTFNNCASNQGKPQTGSPTKPINDGTTVTWLPPNPLETTLFGKPQGNPDRGRRDEANFYA